LQEIRRQYPTIPLVIITAGDAANLKRLLGLDADAFVTVERIEDELGSVVHSLQHRSPLEVAARAFEEAESLDDVARDAVVTALRSVPPIHTVKALANRLGVRRKRIWDGFRPIQVRTGWSCLDLLHAVALWRTIEVVRNGWNIRKAVQDLGLSPRTTRRMCRSLLGCTPSDLLAYADKLEAAVLEFLERALAWDGGGTD
jgi:AraC-like DNA-binding protein